MTTSTAFDQRAATTGAASTPIATSTAATAAASTVPADHPGRWLGGAIGAAVSLAAAIVAANVDARSSDGSILIDWVQIGLLGMPIGFILGRELLPMARGAGWNRAIGTGLLLGWAAPPLGAIEILGGSRLLELGNLSTSIGGPIALVLLPVALPISFLAIVMTIPVGLAWAVLVRLVPDGSLAALRVPAPLARIGVRHVLAIVVVALVALEIAVRA